MTPTHKPFPCELLHELTTFTQRQTQTVDNPLQYPKTNVPLNRHSDYFLIFLDQQAKEENINVELLLSGIIDYIKRES
jgi:serine protease inhibitor ecotin